MLHFSILISKICICFCIIFHSYCMYSNKYVLSGFQNRTMSLYHQLMPLFFINNSIERFMHQCFHLFLLMIQIFSIFMVFSQKVIVKIIVLGNFVVLLWLNSRGNEIQTQYFYIMAGIIYLMGVDYQRKKILLKDNSYDQKQSNIYESKKIN